MAWVALLIAGLLEVVGAVSLKFSEGFTRVGYSFSVLAAFAASFYLLSLSATVLPIGTAYAVWTGIGAAGTGLCGMILFGKPRNAMRVASLGLVILGAMGLKLFS